MKKQMITLFSVILLGITAFANGGGGDFMGKIVFAMEYDLPEAYESQRAMMPTEMTTFIGKNFSRIEQTTGLGDQITISNFKTKETVVLMNLMGQKIALSTNNATVQEANSPSVEITTEKKTIAGYECTKAIYTMKASTEGDEPAKMVIYFTDKINAAANTQFPELKGYPMEYIIETQGMKITYSAKSVTEEKVSDALSKIPSGYEKMTYEDFMKMMGAE